jgi:hypothetical protein
MEEAGVVLKPLFPAQVPKSACEASWSPSLARHHRRFAVLMKGQSELAAVAGGHRLLGVLMPRVEEWGLGSEQQAMGQVMAASRETAALVEKQAAAGAGRRAAQGQPVAVVVPPTSWSTAAAAGTEARGPYTG